MNTNKLDFKPFAKAVADQFEKISKMGTVLFVDVGYNELFELYISSFPEGTNNIFRERTHHDGSYDKNFIRRVGKVIGIDDHGIKHSVWDIYPDDVDPVYVGVSGVLSNKVHSSKILEFAMIEDPKVGYEETPEYLEDGSKITWNHFYAYIPESLRSLDSTKLRAQETIQMYRRACSELTDSAINQVIQLIKSNDLYRGTEFLHLIEGFKKLKEDDDNSELYLFTKVVASQYARIRNTVIGTLLTDLSEGMEVDKAVFSFENKMDPVRYNRPRPVVTEKMREEALKFVQKEGIEDSLHRRHAALADVPITEVLWVSGETAGKMKGSDNDVANILAANTTVKINKNTGTMSADEFMSEVLPTASSVELLVENKHENNLMSLIAPSVADSPSLFKWDNNFSWSYKGAVADSIVERVKKAGGSVDGLLRVSLSWSNTDDLDIHCHTPYGSHIYYANRGEVLDVDMNVNGSTASTSAVENMNFKHLEDGTYSFFVDNYTMRNKSDAGFTLQVAFENKMKEFTFPHNDVNEKTNIGVGINVRNKKVVSVRPKQMVSESRPKTFWGINSQSFIEVDTIMHSPNYWGDNKVGNKHIFFISSQCKNNDTVRGFYNEFLTTKYKDHKRVFELLGEKMEVPKSDHQVSGLGFSSTRNDEVTVRIDKKRTIKLQF